MKKISIFFFFMLLSCKGGGSGNSSSENLTSLNHLGVWALCEDFDINNDSINDASIFHVISIDEEAIGSFRTIYFNPGCLQGNEQYKYAQTSSYERSGNTYTMILRSQTFVSLSSADVTWNNNNSWCGLNNWELNVPQNILGRTCQGEYSAYGDVSTMSANRSANSLLIGELTYDLAISPDLSPRGETIQNGSYIFSDGQSRAIMGIFNNGSYTTYYYDLVYNEYTIETGLYTSSNNVVTLNVTSSNPAGCVSGSVSRRFSNGTLALTLEFEESDLILFALKTNMTESEFRNEYLGGGFSVGCII